MFKNGFSKKIAMFSLAFLLLAGGIVGFVVIPGTVDISNMQTDIEARKNDLELKYIRGDDMNKMMRNLDKASSELDLLKSVYITKGKELEFITAIEKIAADNSISQKINLGASEPFSGNSYSKTSVQINPSGNYENIIKYIKALESLDYYLNISNISLSKSNQSPARSQLETSNNIDITLSITAAAYIRDTNDESQG
jgi:Tfp pilus assembly protein PilO